MYIPWYSRVAASILRIIGMNSVKTFHTNIVFCAADNESPIVSDVEEEEEMEMDQRTPKPHVPVTATLPPAIQPPVVASGNKQLAVNANTPIVLAPSTMPHAMLAMPTARGGSLLALNANILYMQISYMDILAFHDVRAVWLKKLWGSEMTCSGIKFKDFNLGFRQAVDIKYTGVFIYLKDCQFTNACSIEYMPTPRIQCMYAKLEFQCNSVFSFI